MKKYIDIGAEPVHSDHHARLCQLLQEQNVKSRVCIPGCGSCSLDRVSLAMSNNTVTLRYHGQDMDQYETVPLDLVSPATGLRCVMPSIKVSKSQKY